MRGRTRNAGRTCYGYEWNNVERGVVDVVVVVAAGRVGSREREGNKYRFY